MRAHRLRSSLWLANLGLVATVLAVGVGYLADVHEAVAATEKSAAGRKNPALRGLVDAFLDELRRGDGNVLRPAVGRARAERTGKKTIRNFLGPIWIERPPPPPRPPERHDMDTLGHVALLASGTDYDTIRFVFANGGSQVLIPGDVLRAPPTAPRYRFDGIEPIGRQLYDVLHVDLADPDRVLRLRVETGTGLDPDGPLRVLREGEVWPPDPGSPPAADLRARLLELRPVVRRIRADRVRVELGPTGRQLLAGPEAAEVWQSVKTRPVGAVGGMPAGIRIISPGDLPLHRIKIGRGDTLLSVAGEATPTRGALAKVVRRLGPDVGVVEVVVGREGRRITYEFDLRAFRNRR